MILDKNPPSWFSFVQKAQRPNGNLAFLLSGLSLCDACEIGSNYSGQEARRDAPCQVSQPCRLMKLSLESGNEKPMKTKIPSALRVVAAIVCALILAASLAIHAQAQAASGRVFILLAFEAEASAWSDPLFTIASDNAESVMILKDYLIASDADNDGDDSSSEKDLRQNNKPSAPGKQCASNKPRWISQTMIFSSNLFSPFKSRPPP
jgi:hypothetical protein